ncbi:MAG: hypothetical protein VB051_12295 [Candidatus Pelethousia sp.]|nr:hypothetical protein [Candidatus Pelethousia sp.]
MPAHVFVLDEGNYAICTHRGIVGLPEAVSGSKNELATNDALLSRMAIVKEGDYIQLVEKPGLQNGENPVSRQAVLLFLKVTQKHF